MQPIRLIQISDCHIGATEDALYRGEPALNSLEAVIGACKSWQHDLVVASGDLTEDASDASYMLLADQLSRLESPVFCLPGNHDELPAMRKRLSTLPFHMVAEHALHDWRLYFLDTKTDGDPAGTLDSEEVDLLVEDINSQTEAHAMIFMHHQPIPVGSPWIDKYGLGDDEFFRQQLRHCSKLRAVAWGHIHHEWELHDPDVTWLGCPSTVSNSLPAQTKFSFDERGPAARWFELAVDGTLSTGIIYAR